MTNNKSNTLYYVADLIARSCDFDRKHAANDPDSPSLHFFTRKISAGKHRLCRIKCMSGRDRGRNEQKPVL